MNKIAIIGAGGHTRSSLNLLSQYFGYELLGIYDDSFDGENYEYIDKIEVVGKISNIDSSANIFLSIGNNNKRKAYFNLFEKMVIKDNLIHKNAYLEKNIQWGVANQVFANAYINSCVEIGNNNIINTSAVIEHEVAIGNHNHISVGAKVCGRVSIGCGCFIGAGAILIDKINICDNTTIGAGAVVIGDISEAGTYVGNPARKIK